MIAKLRQQLDKHKITSHNKTPNLRSRYFILNFLRRRRLVKTAPGVRASLGLARWLIENDRTAEKRVAVRTACFITGRGRGLTQRFSIARTKVKELASEARLFGVRKSSW